MAFVAEFVGIKSAGNTPIFLQSLFAACWVVS